MTLIRTRGIVALLVVASLALGSAAALAEPVKQALGKPSATATGRPPVPRDVTPTDPWLQGVVRPTPLTPPPPPTKREWSGWLQELAELILGALH